ncbi:type III polyketide synthase [Catelliglobosispora koreensis]|uniref:type III polyketide synthase n=1 Tax=Catelliglobosispora koreensis TaxID=129052 RepID=UPI00036797B0|nr:3-oxoacyl-[acyl-carrier-protein] synthase III C-terminal domain-containing protein [Catelliglobosispora koreensis]
MTTSGRQAPRIAAVEPAFPAQKYTQEEILAELSTVSGRVFTRFAQSAGVEHRHLALPIDQYRDLTGFTDANNAYIDVALELGERAIKAALDNAGFGPQDVDLIVSTTVTGLAVPSLEARLAERLGLRQDVKRLPLFGLGCVAGAAGVARVHDYLLAYPDHVAVLLAVELCSLTVQRTDSSAANLVAASLFGDGAAAVVVAGAGRAGAGPRVLSSRSRLYPGTPEVMGWKIGAEGFRIVLSAEVAAIAEKYLGGDVTDFLAPHGLHPGDIASWVSHPGGPKVIDAIERTLALGPDSLAVTRKSLREKGNMSSVSVLHVLHETMTRPPNPGTPGLMMAMGPGFCSELVLMQW